VRHHVVLVDEVLAELAQREVEEDAMAVEIQNAQVVVRAQVLGDVAVRVAVQVAAAVDGDLVGDELPQPPGLELGDQIGMVDGRKELSRSSGPDPPNTRMPFMALTPSMVAPPEWFLPGRAREPSLGGDGRLSP